MSWYECSVGERYNRKLTITEQRHCLSERPELATFHVYKFAMCRS